jgi:uncharacterized protein YabE (DUF348 family)
MLYKAIIVVGGFFLAGYMFLNINEPKQDFTQKETVRVYDGSSPYEYAFSQSATVKDFLSEQGWAFQEEDVILPSPETRLTSGMSIRIERARTMTVLIGKDKTPYKTRATTVGEALRQSGITLDEDDILEPKPETTLGEDREVRITRVTISEEKEETKIAFKTEEEKDDNLSWPKKVRQVFWRSGSA